MLLTLVSFVFVLGVLVFIHELGHFLVAKKVGIKVEKFSLGFPPNIFAKKWGETEYCIGIIPLGGYVKMAGENPDETATGDPGEFMSKTVAQRSAVIFAGPFMNYVLAIFLSIGIVYFGGRPLVDTERILVGEVSTDGTALAAGLAVDDQIIAIDGVSVTHFDSLRIRINAVVEENINLTWVRGDDTLSADIKTMATPVPTIDGGVDTVGIIGFRQKIIGYETYGIGESISLGISNTHMVVAATVNFVYMAVSGQVSPKMIGGPLFIARQSGKEAEKGPRFLFNFMMLLSVNLAILNVLPIPVLDGGHLVFLAIEKIKGSPLTMKTRAYAQQVGMVLLLCLIVFATYNDILRAFKGF